MTLFAEVRHPSSAKVPLVLLHGFGGIGAIWAPVISLLDQDLPLIVYDLPGHGRSLDADGVGHAGMMAKAILADIDRRGISRFHLCGHSMGGAIATLIALNSERRVPSLTLVAPGGFGPFIHHEALRRYGSAVETCEIKDALAAMTAPGHVVSEGELQALADARREAGAGECLIAILKSFLIERDGQTEQGTLPLMALERKTTRTCLLWGTVDPILPVTQAKNVWPRAEVTLIDGAGHMLIDEAPGLVAGAIVANLAEG